MRRHTVNTQISVCRRSGGFRSAASEVGKQRLPRVQRRRTATPTKSSVVIADQGGTRTIHAAWRSAKVFFTSDICSEAAGEDARLCASSTAVWDEVDGNVIDRRCRLDIEFCRPIPIKNPAVGVCCERSRVETPAVLPCTCHYTVRARHFEVVPASSTKLFDSCALKLASRCVHLLSWERFDVPQANFFYRSTGTA